MKTLTTILFGAAATATIFLTLEYTLSMPDVHINHLTGQCVAVHNHPSPVFGTSSYTCDTMPTRYTRVLVAAN